MSEELNRGMLPKPVREQMDKEERGRKVRDRIRSFFRIGRRGSVQGQVSQEEPAVPYHETPPSQRVQKLTPEMREESLDRLEDTGK